MCEDDCNYDNIEIVLSEPTWHVASAKEIQYGDFIVLNNGDVVQVETIKKY